MKTTFSLFLSCSLLATMFFSCQKEKPISPSSINSTITTTNSTGSTKRQKETLCVCTGFTLKIEGSDISCPSGTGCSKITRCPCDVAIATANGSDVVFVESHYDKYKIALTNGTLTTFFSTHQWNHLFPDLNNNPDILAQLRSGALTMVEKTNLAGSLMELAIPPSKLGTVLTVADIKMSLEIPAGSLSK